MAKKAMLNTYKQVPYLIGGTVVVATVIVGGYLGYRQITKSSNTRTNTKIVIAPTSSPTATKKMNYDGLYRGNTGVMSGLANVRVTVSGSTLSGDAKYIAKIAGFNVEAPVNITGTVSTNGAVNAKIAGTAEAAGQKIAVSGTSTGQIKDSSMNCNYAVSAAGMTDSGKVTLTK